MKGVLLLGISYALLTACGTHVSLTENYFEDENFYNPTLPSPQFALESLKSTDIYSESVSYTHLTLPTNREV